MRAAPLARLLALLAVARAAEEARLARHRAEIDALRRESEELRALLRAAGEETGAGDDPVAGDILAHLRWQDGLARRLDALRRRAAALEAESAPLRAALARALGRERAMESLHARAAAEERRRALLRAEARSIPGRGRATPAAAAAPLAPDAGDPSADQSSAPSSDSLLPARASPTGSPGMA